MIDPVEVKTFGKFGDAMVQVLLYEFKATLNAYPRALGPDARVRSLEDVIAFNEKHRDREMPFFGQETFLEAQEKNGLDSPAYRKARDEVRTFSRADGLYAALDAHGLDALVALTSGPAHLMDLVNGDRLTGGTWSLCAAAGCPSITVPAGDVFGLPVGISFMGRAFAEGALIRLAFAFEQLTNARKPPRFLPTVYLLH